jgi:two-component system catabolic regulation response regulator CreB
MLRLAICTLAPSLAAMPALIVVIEDEPAIRDSLEYVLGVEGFRVVVAPTLAAGRAALATELPALVVLDVGLPDGSGFDFCRELRRTSSVPVIFLTARADEIDRVVGLELGADDYVAKPFSPREVAARVKAVLRRTGVPGPVVTPATGRSPLVIDEQRRHATLDGQILALSRQELRVLEVLAAHPGTVFTRAQLLDLAWDDASAVFDRIVDSHIKAIRAAVRKVRPDCEAIITIRGEGYALREQW